MFNHTLPPCDPMSCIDTTSAKPFAPRSLTSPQHEPRGAQARVCGKRSWVLWWRRGRSSTAKNRMRSEVKMTQAHQSPFATQSDQPAAWPRGGDLSPLNLKTLKP